MSDQHVIVFSQDESLAAIITEYLTFEGVSATRHTTRFDVFETIRTTQPIVLVLIQPFSDCTWLCRLAETLYWDPDISTQLVVVSHEPEQFRLRFAARSGFISAILPVPFDYNELTGTVRALLRRASHADEQADQQLPTSIPPMKGVGHASSRTHAS